MWRFLMVLALLLCSAETARADYELGAAAARRGDYDIALKAWQPLADEGNASAQNDLGFLYANGHGVAKDEVRAAQLYRQAAEQGLPIAQFNIGYCYLHGQGVPPDPPVGVAWYRRAAEQGLVKAQFNLGVRYYTGEGIEKDTGEAYFWFALAADGGHERAREVSENLTAELDPETVRNVAQRVDQWTPVSEEPAQSPAKAVAEPPLEPAAETVPEPPALPVLEPPLEPPPLPLAETEPAPSQVPSPVPANSRELQLGALNSAEDAQSEWQRLLRKNRDVLGDYEPRVDISNPNPQGRVYHRLRIGPLSDADARELCALLESRRVACLVVNAP